MGFRRQREKGDVVPGRKLSERSQSRGRFVGLHPIAARLFAAAERMFGVLEAAVEELALAGGWLGAFVLRRYSSSSEGRRR